MGLDFSLNYRPEPSKENSQNFAEDLKEIKTPEDLANAKDNLETESANEEMRAEIDSMKERQKVIEKMLPMIAAPSTTDKIGYLNGEKYDNILKRSQPADVLLGLGALIALGYGVHRLFKGNTLKGLAGIGIGGGLAYYIGTGEIPFEKNIREISANRKEKTEKVLNTVEKTALGSKDWIKGFFIKKTPETVAKGQMTLEELQNIGANEFGGEHLRRMGMPKEVADKIKPGTFESRQIYRELIWTYGEGLKANAETVAELMGEVPPKTEITKTENQEIEPKPEPELNPLNQEISTSEYPENISEKNLA